MTSILLYSAPGTCARVPMITLEEIGVAYETRLVRFRKNEQKSAEYKKYNPKGKVPTLVYGDTALTENVAILGFLNDTFPEARILPAANSPMERAQITADLSFCSATLHPIVSRIRISHVWGGEVGSAAVKELGMKAMREYFDLIDSRLADGAWWYGNQWSSMDAYLYWIFWRVEGAGFDTSPYPNYQEHTKRMEDRPSVKRFQARENAHIAQLEAEGLFPADPALAAGAKPKG